MLQSIAYRGDCPNCPVPEQCDQLKTLTGHQKQSIAFFQAWWHGWLPKEQGGLKNSGCCLLPLGDWRLASLFTATMTKMEGLWCSAFAPGRRSRSPTVVRPRGTVTSSHSRNFHPLQGKSIFAFPVVKIQLVWPYNAWRMMA